MSISNLTNTTWTLNSNLNSPYAYIGFTYNIDFLSSGNLYNKLKFYGTVEFGATTILNISSVSYYNETSDTTVYTHSNQTKWANESYRTITITGGDDVENSTLIGWLGSHAVLQEVSVIYKNDHIWKTTQTDDKNCDVAGYYCEDDIHINYVRPTPTVQSKSVTPTESAQTITPDNGYDGLSQVFVGAISSSYVGSNIPRQAAQTIMPTTTDQTIASDKYLTGTQTIKGDANLLASNIVSGVSIFGVVGTASGGGGITVVETSDSHGGTIVTITGEVITLQDKSVTPSTLSQIVSADSGYTGLNQVNVAGDANLLASNIASGVSIFGVTGTLSGGGGAGWETAPESYVDALINKTIIEASGSMVINIRAFAFYSCSSLTTISFPNCQFIGSSAFYSCGELTEANFPKCSIIQSYAFQYCSNLTSISFPNCVNVGYTAFARCDKLTIASFPRCTSIAGYAFQNCSSLNFASFPNCLSINQSAFYNCINLTSVYFPNCISLGGCFANCTNLTEVIFPKCSYISNSTFYNCTNLTMASFLVCRSIGSSAFYNCSKLESIYILAKSVPSLAYSNIFTNTPITDSTYLGHFGSIYVLSNLLNIYKTSTNWSYFADRFVGV